MSNNKTSLKSVRVKIDTKKAKKEKADKKFGGKEKASKIKELSKKTEAKIAVDLQEPSKLSDDDLRTIIRTSKVHFAEANRLLESRKAENKLNKKLSA